MRSISNYSLAVIATPRGFVNVQKKHIWQSTMFRRNRFSDFANHGGKLTAKTKSVEKTAHERYCSMMPESKRVFDRAANVLPGGVESNFRALEPFPFYATYADGSKLYDVDGHELIDYLLSQGAIMLGHRRREIIDAVHAQIEKGANTAIPTELCVKVANKIGSFVPSMQMVRFCNSGTEATMHALRLARGFTGKDKIAKPEGGYHGVHDYGLWSLWAPNEYMGDERRPNATPFSRGIPKAVGKTVVIFPFNDVEATYDILKKESKDLAAVITEPIMGNVGCLLPKDSYLKELRKICDELDVLLIFDEVITGLRMGRGGAQGLFKVRPDLTTMGKVLGGGFQLAAFGGSKRVMDELITQRKEWPTTTFHGGTYNAHPVSLAASLATMKILQDDRVYSGIERNSKALFGGLQDLCDDNHVRALVSRCRSMGHLYFDAEEITTARKANNTNWEKLGKWCMECLLQGVMFGHPKGEKMFLSAAHTKSDVEKSLEVADAGLKAIR